MCTSTQFCIHWYNTHKPDERDRNNLPFFDLYPASIYLDRNRSKKHELVDLLCRCSPDLLNGSTGLVMLIELVERILLLRPVFVTYMRAGEGERGYLLGYLLFAN